MLLAIDAEIRTSSLCSDRATLVTAGVFSASWRTSDELGPLVDGLFTQSGIDRRRVDGVILGSGRSTAGTMKTMVGPISDDPLLSSSSGNTGMPIRHENWRSRRSS